MAQAGTDLYIVDQHAAHERILFDRLNGYAEKIPAQGLLIHRVVKFDSRESELIEKNLAVFKDLGFTLEPSGENEFRVTEVPLDAADTDADVFSLVFDGTEAFGNLRRCVAFGQQVEDFFLAWGYLRGRDFRHFNLFRCLFLWLSLFHHYLSDI